MTKEELVELVNSDLKNEYKHMLFYLRSSVIVRGLHREPIKAFLEKEAQGETLHVQEFTKRVVALGGRPVAESNPFPYLESPIEILSYALGMENEVIEIYAKRMDQADSLKSVDGISTRLFYENQLQDSYDDMIEIKEMIASLQN